MGPIGGTWRLDLRNIAVAFFCYSHDDIPHNLPLAPKNLWVFFFMNAQITSKSNLKFKLKKGKENDSL